MEDPFACFDDDSDENDCDIDSSAEKKETASSTTRDPSCGVLAFHAGTEQALLKHVESKLSHSSSQTSLADSVLEHIDDFSMNRHWMMHIGAEKATILRDFMKSCCSAVDENRPLICVELGTYCGYSSIFIAKTLKAWKRKFSLYSVEVVKENAQVAEEMVRLAGLEQNVDILLLDPDKETLSSLLGQKNVSFIDFLFIDHDKSLYMADLKELELSGCIHIGCHVAADNVVFAGIDDYRGYIMSLAKQGVVSSRLANTFLEYCEPDLVGCDSDKKNLCKDGVELSVYLKEVKPKSKDGSD